MRSEITQRLLDACIGQPATIPWPHRLLHDAVAEILRLNELWESEHATVMRLIRERDQSLAFMRVAFDQRDAIQGGLTEVTERLERAEARVTKLEALGRKLLDTNGGPIDAEDTTDGLAYVMVRRDVLDALDAALTPGGGQARDSAVREILDQVPVILTKRAEGGGR